MDCRKRLNNKSPAFFDLHLSARILIKEEISIVGEDHSAYFDDRKYWRRPTLIRGLSGKSHRTFCLYNYGAPVDTRFLEETGCLVCASTLQKRNPLVNDPQKISL
jgi:hypothetical protein